MSKYLLYDRGSDKDYVKKVKSYLIPPWRDASPVKKSIVRHKNKVYNAARVTHKRATALSQAMENKIKKLEEEG